MNKSKQLIKHANDLLSDLRRMIDDARQRVAMTITAELGIQQEFDALRERDRLTPDLIFRDPYVLDFLRLTGAYNENDLEEAVLREIERFLLELGNHFTFAARQKRMVIDGEDFHLDLLFFHRVLQRLVALELKIGKFEAGHKGQMELYLRWLDKYERLPHEDAPLGLILCAEAGAEQVKLLQLEQGSIRVAQYLTDLPPRHLLEAKLREAIWLARKRLLPKEDAAGTSV